MSITLLNLRITWLNRSVMVYSRIQSQAAKSIIPKEPQTVPRHLKTVTSIQIEESAANSFFFCLDCWVSYYPVCTGFPSLSPVTQVANMGFSFGGQRMGMERNFWLLLLLKNFDLRFAMS